MKQQLAAWDDWDTNAQALASLRRHMPVDLYLRSQAELAGAPTPNGEFLPLEIAKKFKRTKVLQLLRVHPQVVHAMDANVLVEHYSTTSLSLTEHRALHAYLQPIASEWRMLSKDQKHEDDFQVRRKHEWSLQLEQAFRDTYSNYQRHLNEHGDDLDEGECPLDGKCPIEADIDYSGDYGYPDTDVYGDFGKELLDGASNSPSGGGDG